MKDFNFLPFQLSFLLGTPYRNILDWIEAGKLKTNGNWRIPLVSLSDLIDFLGQNREYVGRLYCENPVPLFDELRKSIIEEMDTRWPLERSNWSNF